jgi:perosamine synthetase
MTYIPLYQIRLGQETEAQVLKTLRKGQLASGPEVIRFEQAFAHYCDTTYAVAVNSGTAALHAALKAVKVGVGDEVIVPAFSFVATANAVLMSGARPVFADIEPRTFNLNPESVERLVSKKTKAMIAVDLYGLPADYLQLNKLAQAYGLIVVEDAAQAVGAGYQDKKAGALADIACFSFYATKNLMAGEGGMVTTDKAEWAASMERFRNHGRSKTEGYEHVELGFNYRMTDIEAVIALAGLEEIDEKNQRRREIAKLYDHAFESLEGLERPLIPTQIYTPVFHQYTIRLTEKAPLTREVLKFRLWEDFGIETGVYYPAPLNHYPHLKEFKVDRELKVAENAAASVLSLPIRPDLSYEEIATVVEGVEACLKG